MANLVLKIKERKRCVLILFLIILLLTLWEIYCIKWSVREYGEEEAQKEYTGFANADNMFMEYDTKYAKITLFYNSGRIKVFNCRGNFVDLHGLKTNVLGDDTRIEVFEGRTWQTTPLEYLHLKWRFLRINYKNTPNNLVGNSGGSCYYIVRDNKYYNYRGPAAKGEKQFIGDNGNGMIKGEPVVYKLKNAFVRGEFRRFNDVMQSSYKKRIDEEEVKNWYDV